MKQFSKYVGMDVHKATIAVAVAEGRGGEVRYLGEIANTTEAIGKLVRQLKKGRQPFVLLRSGAMRLWHPAPFE